MLGYLTAGNTGEGDRLLAEVAETLAAQGLALVGAVQDNLENSSGARCHMDLRVLGAPAVLRISQDTGPQAVGCRLNPEALAQAVHLVETTLRSGAPALMILNKFGKQECEGGGFRTVIAEALMAGIPVLTSVSEGNRAAFLAFADGMAEALPQDPAQVLRWCQGAMASA